MNMNKFLIIALIGFLSSALSGCNNDDENQKMVWELVSNSDTDMVSVAIDTTGDFSSPSNIWIMAGYKSGDVVLRCVNHPINWSLTGPNDSYTNPDMSFTLSKIDDRTLRLHFEENTSGKQEETDQITLTNADSNPIVCNTFLWITRSFGELTTERAANHTEKQ